MKVGGNENVVLAFDNNDDDCENYNVDNDTDDNNENEFFLTILLLPPPRGCAARCSWFTRVFQTEEIKEMKTVEE